MSVVVELRVPASQFVLAEAMGSLPEMVVEFEQFVPSNAEAMPFLWATGDESRAFEDALAADPSVADYRMMDQLETGGLFQVAWRDGNPLRSGLQRGDEAVLQAVGRDGKWFLKVRFGSKESLSAFQTYCGEAGVEFTLLKLYETGAPNLGRYDLTAAQREALIVALRQGYFDVPRQATLEDVADELDLSTNAVSERIRRGQANLFQAALTVGRPPHAGKTADESGI